MEEKTVIAETDRLILRRYMECDLQDLYEYLSKENVYFWKDGKNRPLWKDTYIYAKLKP